MIEPQFAELTAAVRLALAIVDEQVATFNRCNREHPDWPPVDPTPLLNMRASCRRILSRLASEGDRLPNSLFHKLRRSVATHTSARAGLAAAIALLGHSGPELTARYIDPSFLPANDATEWLPSLTDLLKRNTPPSS
jgi:hypothetical protein